MKEKNAEWPKGQGSDGTPWRRGDVKGRLSEIVKCYRANIKQFVKHLFSFSNRKVTENPCNSSFGKEDCPEPTCNILKE